MVILRIFFSQQDSCRGALWMFIAVCVLSACLSLCISPCLASLERGSHPVTRRDKVHRWSGGKLYKYIPTHPHLKCSTVTFVRTRLTTAAAIWLTMCGKAALEFRRSGGKSLMNIQTVIFRAKTNLTFWLENKGLDLFFQPFYLLDPPQSGLEGATSEKINVTVLP